MLSWWFCTNIQNDIQCKWTVIDYIFTSRFIIVLWCKEFKCMQSNRSNVTGLVWFTLLIRRWREYCVKSRHVNFLVKVSMIWLHYLAWIAGVKHEWEPKITKLQLLVRKMCYFDEKGVPLKTRRGPITLDPPPHFNSSHSTSPQLFVFGNRSILCKYCLFGF